MKFSEAVLELKAGKKIRRAIWSKDSYIQKEGEAMILNNNLQSFKPAVNTFFTDDWELFEEKLYLSTIIEGIKVADNDGVKVDTLRIHPKSLARFRNEYSNYLSDFEGRPTMIFGLEIEEDDSIEEEKCYVYKKIKKAETLSDKIYENMMWSKGIIEVKYIREFIKKLKEEFRWTGAYTGSEISDFIDRKAGERLV